MKYLLIMFLTSCFGAKVVKEKPNNMSTQSKSSIYDFKITSIDGEIIDFSTYKGKKILLVNVASKCGYTPQYKDLQKLHEQYGDKVVILGFPANNFGAQEPGTNEEISEFCEKNYGVSFQMFEKISVKGNDIHPLYNWLSNKELNGWNEQSPTWNFCKYLVNEKGELVNFYSASVNPMGEEIIKAITQ